MERDNKKTGIIFILTGIIILLMIYLILFVYKSSTQQNIQNSDESLITVPSVSNECSFNMTIDEFNNIAGNNNICSGMNKINLIDTILNGKQLNVIAYYSTFYIKGVGIYINDNPVFVDTILKEHKIGIFENKLFITSFSENSANFKVFDENVNNIYNLENELNKIKIVDPTFSLINKNSFLTINDLQPSSFVFENGKISFNSTIASCVNGVSGSNYNITYSGTNFSKINYISNISC